MLLSRWLMIHRSDSYCQAKLTELIHKPCSGGTEWKWHIKSNPDCCFERTTLYILQTMRVDPNLKIKPADLTLNVIDINALSVSRLHSAAPLERSAARSHVPGLWHVDPHLVLWLMKSTWVFRHRWEINLCRCSADSWGIWSVNNLLPVLKHCRGI